MEYYGMGIWCSCWMDGMVCRCCIGCNVDIVGNDWGCVWVGGMSICESIGLYCKEFIELICIKSQYGILILLNIWLQNILYSYNTLFLSPSFLLSTWYLSPLSSLSPLYPPQFLYLLTLFTGFEIS